MPTFFLLRDQAREGIFIIGFWTLKSGLLMKEQKLLSENVRQQKETFAAWLSRSSHLPRKLKILGSIPAQGKK